MSNEPTTEDPTTDDVTGNIRRETPDLPGFRARVAGEESDADDDVAGHFRARLHERSNDDVAGFRARVEGADDEDDVEGHFRAR